jgi:hypothetical protein
MKSTIKNHLLVLFAVFFIFMQNCKKAEEPELSAIVPAKGLIGDPVIVKGTYLNDATSVSFNGTESLILNNTGSELQTVVPSGISTGLHNVTVQTNAGTSNQIPFEVVEMPEFTDAFPPELEMAVPESNYIKYPVLIYGNFLSGVINITFDDIEAEIFTNNQKVITTTVPEGVSTGPVKIKVRTVKGTATIDFNVQGPPPGGNVPLNFSIVNIPPPGYVPLISNQWTCGLFSGITDSTFVELNSDENFDENFKITGKFEFSFLPENDYNNLNFVQITNTITGEFLAGQFSAVSDNPCVYRMILISSVTGEVFECTVDVSEFGEPCDE